MLLTVSGFFKDQWALIFDMWWKHEPQWTHSRYVIETRLGDGAVMKVMKVSFAESQQQCVLCSVPGVGLFSARWLSSLASDSYLLQISVPYGGRMLTRRPTYTTLNQLTANLTTSTARHLLTGRPLSSLKNLQSKWNLITCQVNCAHHIQILQPSEGRERPEQTTSTSLCLGVKQTQF